MRRELLERGFGHFGKNKSAFLPPQRKDASPLEIGERVNRLNPSMLAVRVQMLRMGAHCLVKEFHPEFHVEVCSASTIPSGRVASSGNVTECHRLKCYRPGDQPDDCVG